MKVTKGSHKVQQIVEGKLRAQAMKCALPLNISPGLIIQQSRGLQCVNAAATTGKHNGQVSPTPQPIQQHEEQICEGLLDPYYAHKQVEKRIGIYDNPKVGRLYGS